ncbi:karyopherin KAP123 SCDLUD_000156 [Saccharomycodes ludwigii]|uniref:karyopherin KAP123 n=1 Tax=Saccharomycodes ludwigii TaxID=36035 RepID=UPI001E84773A|nr:hypothetical protein SCDLUD_000156 [Saccharomycodes ludwigii]KAH3902576.1 hypothetical protein SCDLUD_000156 [Saccharomycodes ludwigii]
MDQQYIAELEQTLSVVVVPNNANLKDATNLLTKKFYSEQRSLPALIHILQTNQSNELRQLAGIEARKLVFQYWKQLDINTQNEIKTSLLNKVFAEQNNMVRHSMTRVIAAIGNEEIDEKKWPELVPNLIQVASAQDPQARETALFILFTLLEGFNPSLSLYNDDLLNLFSITISENPASTLESRSLSVQSVNLVAQLIEEQAQIDQNQVAKFTSLIPSVVGVLEAVIKADDAVNTKLIFNCLNDFLLLDSQMTGNETIIDLIKLGIQISTNVQLDEEVRTFAIRFLISALSYRKTKISQAKLGPELTLAALKIASEEIDVEEELNNEDEAAENEEDTPSLLAIRVIAFASSELPPSQVTQIISSQLASMLQSSNQFERRAILLAISVSVTGSPDYILSQLEKIVPATLNGLKDPSPIVQLAALRCIVQLTTDLQGEVAKYHEQYLPLIMAIIDNAKSIVIYKYATTALDGLLEFTAYEDISKYLEPLMNKLFHMLDTNPSSKLKAAIVSAIGSAAFAAGTAFTPFFKTSVEYLTKYIQNSGNIEGMSEDDIELRALTFENISTMGRAVRSQAFAEFAEPLVNSAYEAVKTDSARLRESGYAFIANMAKVYGKDFAPFLKTIMPEIFKTLQQAEYDFNFEDGEEVGDGLTEEDLVNKFTVNTGISYEKEVAAAALSELAISTKENFLEYVEPSLEILKQQAEESYGLKETALNTLWKVAKAVLLTGNAQVEDNYPKGVPATYYIDTSSLAVIQTVRETCIDSLEDEFETSVVIVVLEDFGEMLKKFGAIIIADSNNTSYLEKLCLTVLQVLKGSHTCQTIDYEEEGQKAELEDPEELDASETEATLVDVALEVLVGLAFCLGNDFTKIFENFKPTIFQLFNSKSKNKRSAAVGALSEIVSGLKESNTYTQEMMEALVIKLTSDKSLEVRGNAAYGVGLLIQYATFDVSSIYEPVLKGLYQLLSSADQKSATIDDGNDDTRDNIEVAYANATGCVARMTLKHQNLIPLEHTLPALLSHLPLKTAFEEYTPIFEIILRLYSDNNEVIVSQTPKIIEIFADVFKKENERIQLENESTLGREEYIERLKPFKDDEIKGKVVELLRYLNTKYDGIVSGNQVLAPVIA